MEKMEQSLFSIFSRVEQNQPDSIVETEKQK